MIDTLQIYIARSFDPYENLAVEKYLLDTTPENACTLYLWQNENTVVIGRNQNAWAQCRTSLLDEDGVHLARRLSGGGAVFHDLGNLNFTFLCSSENYDLQKQLRVIRAACTLAGIETEISGRNDILADGRKFSGNAFYNSKGKSYHHGTILINADMEKMARYLTPPIAKLEAKGVKSVKSRTINLCTLSPTLTCEDMKNYMVQAFKEVYSKPITVINNLDNEEIFKLAEKYKSREYLYDTPMSISFSCEKYFTWGTVRLELKVSDGEIKDIRLYTDAMDHSLPQSVSSALISCRFNKEDIKSALYRALPENIAMDLAELLENEVM